MPLDKVMTYGHIKEWLIQTSGYNHWQELPQDLKPYILLSRNASYPDWYETEVKPFAV